MGRLAVVSLARMSLDVVSQSASTNNATFNNKKGRLRAVLFCFRTHRLKVNGSRY
jgi:hypothetical protein